MAVIIKAAYGVSEGIIISIKRNVVNIVIISNQHKKRNAARWLIVASSWQQHGIKAA